MAHLHLHPLPLPIPPLTAEALDPYRLLEIPQDADHVTIRRAFRRQAMRWHPDRNPAPEAVERFKEIRAAYEGLLDAAGDDRQADEEAPVAPRGADRHEELWLSLEEAMLGCDTPFSIRREGQCAECGGSGSVELARTRMCSACHGSGKLRTDKGLQACADCGGKGFSRRAGCEVCEGSGRAQADQVVTVHVAAGVLPGEVLRLRGLGHPAEGDGPPGELFLGIRLEPHAIFRLEGRDLHVNQPVSALRLIAGGRISVAGPLGPIVTELSSSDSRRRELRLAGKGFPGRGGKMDAAGDLVVMLEPVLPSGLSDKQRARLSKLEAELQQDASHHYDRLEQWWRMYRSKRS